MPDIPRAILKNPVRNDPDFRGFEDRRMTESEREIPRLAREGIPQEEATS